MAVSGENKLDFIPIAAEQGFLPSFDWRSIGAVFALPSSSSSSTGLTAAKLSGRCVLTMREGFDPIDASGTGRVVEGNGDAGITLRHGSTAFSLTANNLGYRAGLDDPLAAAQAGVGESSVPSIKLTAAKEYAEDCYAAISYDLTHKKPELSAGWAGSTFTEQAAIVVHADPLYRTYKLSASVSFPGPEWRDTLLDTAAGVLHEPVDDGGRHRLWVQHTIKDKQWGFRTRVGGAFDVGRIFNCIGEYVNEKVEPRIPPLVWRIPLMPRLYNLIVPEQDPDQVRYHISGVDVEASHEFGTKGAQLGLAKHMKYATVRGTWHTSTNEAGLQYNRSGISLCARIRKEPGGCWSKPSLMLHVEPLGLL